MTDLEQTLLLIVRKLEEVEAQIKALRIDIDAIEQSDSPPNWWTYYYYPSNTVGDWIERNRK